MSKRTKLHHFKIISRGASPEPPPPSKAHGFRKFPNLKKIFLVPTPPPPPLPNPGYSPARRLITVPRTKTTSKLNSITSVTKMLKHMTDSNTKISAEI